MCRVVSFDLSLCAPLSSSSPRSARSSAWALILLGSRSNALDTEAALWLPAVHDLPRAAHTSGMPTLGIRLAHQIIADSFGGAVPAGLASQNEEGAVPLSLTEAGRTAPLLGTLATGFVHAAQVWR
ncbi:hypothetical protein CKJ83_03335 [Corynebacterium hadale]|nr:hypothetical protein CKJ83_03335 [Corynebacterium hadale]